MSKCEFIIPWRPTSSRPCESPQAAPFTPLRDAIGAPKGLLVSACLATEETGRVRCPASAANCTCDIAVCSFRSVKLPAHHSGALETPKEKASC